MQFDILTIFPEMFNSYFEASILGRAQKNKLIKIKTHDIRKYSTDKHNSVDDKPYGGGAGMVMMIEPIFRALKKIKKTKNPSTSSGAGFKFKKKKSRTILFSAKGKKFDQQMAREFAELDQLIMICGRYEGVDERVKENLVDEEVCIGEYVLTGGELPAMIVTDAVSRLLPGVLGSQESLKEESFSTKNYLEYPQYTRPENFRGWEVPEILLSGNHKKIEEWREKESGIKNNKEY